jgi:hypothetical protein
MRGADGKPECHCGTRQFLRLEFGRQAQLAEFFFNNLTNSKSMSGFTDVIFCPMLVNDTARTLIKMLKKKLSGLYHLVGPQAMSKYHFGVEIARKFSLREVRSRRSRDIFRLGGEAFQQFMAVYPQAIHRSGRGSPPVFHRFARVLHTKPTGLSPENPQLSTKVGGLSPSFPQLSTGFPVETGVFPQEVSGFWGKTSFLQEVIHRFNPLIHRFFTGYTQGADMKALLRLEEALMFAFALFLFSELDYFVGAVCPALLCPRPEHARLSGKSPPRRLDL